MMNRNEFEKSLSHPCEFWEHKTALDVAGLIGLHVARMVDYNQKNPHHCYNLFAHSLHTVENIVESELLIKVAAFFHDIGKPDVAKEKDGRLVFYNHPAKSVAIAQPILKEMGYSLKEWQLICFWIENHDDFINWDLSLVDDIPRRPNMVEINIANLTRHIKKYSNAAVFKNYQPAYVWKGLIELCRADSSAQAELVFKDGNLVNSKKKKLFRVETIMCLMEKFFEN